MGIRLIPGEGDKDKPVEIRVGKGLNPDKPSSPPDRADDPARVPSSSTSAKEVCSQCGGPFREKDGTYGSKRIESGKPTVLTCKSCSKANRSKSKKG